MRTYLVVCAALWAVPPGLAESAPVVIARPEAFETLVNPQCSHCRDEAKRRAGELRDDDQILCWIRGYSDGGAIPMRFFLNPYRVISDTYGVFVSDPDAGFARGFAPSLDFRFHGWRNGVMVMKHKDGTLYSCLTGNAFEGPRKGDRLKPVPTLVSAWGWWLKHYPQNVAYHMFDKYKAIELPDKPHPDSLASRAPVDNRLPVETLVLGVSDGKNARAYRLADVEKAGLVQDQVGDQAWVILWSPATKTAAAYLPVATSPKATGEMAKNMTLQLDGKNADAPFRDMATGSRWDIAGRAVEGELKGWTLTWLDGVQVKWFAWSAEYPQTTVYTAAKGDKTESAPAEKMQEIAGSAEFLRAVPKKFARLEAVDAARRTVTLLIEGETMAKTWPLTPDAEIKVQGWWGRLEHLTRGDRVWAWLKLDRRKEPVAIFMLADELSEQDIHGKKVFVQTAGGKTRLTLDQASFESRRSEQQKVLRKLWTEEGLPGTVAFMHVYSGELDYLLDHEAMRWGRSLQPGDVVQLQSDPAIKAVVKTVKPWRERTALRLVVKGIEAADLVNGQRLRLKMTPPAREVQEALLPPDLDRPRSPEERVEWFLASLYCTCKIGGDGCTGHFYTLASCNPNACGMPRMMRKRLAGLIDMGLTDRQIFEELYKERGQELLRPHLMP
jgi:hypothetical protein